MTKNITEVTIQKKLLFDKLESTIKYGRNSSLNIMYIQLTTNGQRMEIE